MTRFVNIKQIIATVLVGVLSLILMHDIQPVFILTQAGDQTNPISTETSSDHSEECAESCPCPIHTLDNSLGIPLYQFEASIIDSRFRVATYLKPESTSPIGIDRPPEA